MKERANPWAKRLDFLLGIPLLLLLSLFRPRARALKSPPRRIALLKSSAIGDTVILAAIVADLEHSFPAAEIVLFVGNSNLRAAEILFGAERVRLLPMLNPLKAIKSVRAEAFDVFIDCDSWPRINALLAFAARASLTIGFKTEGQSRHHAFAVSVPHSKKIHEIENYRSLIRQIGATTGALPRMTASGAPDGTFFTTVILHPWPGGSRAAEKMWPETNWIELARRLSQEGIPVRLSAGPADREKAKILADSAPEARLQVLDTPSLEVLLRRLTDARLVVTVDTGIAHISAALGQHTLVLHGPTSPTRWGALGPNVTTLKDGQEPTIHLGFESAKSKQLTLSIDEVYRKISSILRAKEPRNSS